MTSTLFQLIVNNEISALHILYGNSPHEIKRLLVFIRTHVLDSRFLKTTHIYSDLTYLENSLTLSKRDIS